MTVQILKITKMNNIKMFKLNEFFLKNAID